MSRIANKQRTPPSAVKKWVAFLTLLCLAVAVVSTLIFGFSNGQFETTFYQVRSDQLSENVRVVQLSDLHLNQFGDNNSQLVERIRTLEPDLIAITGDMTMAKDTNLSPVVELCRQLGEIAPVYYAWGNHEYGDIMNGVNTTLPDQLEAVGVHILDYQSELVEINGNQLSIGGMYADTGTFYRNAPAFLEEFCRQECFTLLLTHHPELFDELMEGYPVDLALCGHAHGGLIKLPGIGALYAPGQGFFPELTQGCMKRLGSTVVISRGLGTSSIFPRFNNRPELVVVDIDCY